jgi:hypothetical protein
MIRLLTRTLEWHFSSFEGQDSLMSKTSRPALVLTLPSTNGQFCIYLNCHILSLLGLILNRVWSWTVEHFPLPSPLLTHYKNRHSKLTVNTYTRDFLILEFWSESRILFILFILMLMIFYIYVKLNKWQVVFSVSEYCHTTVWTGILTDHFYLKFRP